VCSHDSSLKAELQQLIHAAMSGAPSPLKSATAIAAGVVCGKSSVAFSERPPPVVPVFKNSRDGWLFP
jgi:hypothetical protein